MATCIKCMKARQALNKFLPAVMRLPVVMDQQPVAGWPARKTKNETGQNRSQAPRRIGQ